MILSSVQRNFRELYESHNDYGKRGKLKLIFFSPKLTFLDFAWLWIPGNLNPGSAGSEQKKKKSLGMCININYQYVISNQEKQNKTK